jgi:hypothetical protein
MAAEVCAYLRRRYDVERHLAMAASDQQPARWHVGRRGLVSAVCSDAGIVAAELDPADAAHAATWDPHRAVLESVMK